MSIVLATLRLNSYLIRMLRLLKLAADTTRNRLGSFSCMSKNNFIGSLSIKAERNLNR